MCFSNFSFRNTFCVSVGKTLWKSQNVSLNGFFQGKHHPAPAVKEVLPCLIVIWGEGSRLSLLEGNLELCGLTKHNQSICDGYHGGNWCSWRLVASLHRLVVHRASRELCLFREQEWRLLSHSVGALQSIILWG